MRFWIYTLLKWITALWTASNWWVISLTRKRVILFKTSANKTLFSSFKVTTAFSINLSSSSSSLQYLSSKIDRYICPSLFGFKCPYRTFFDTLCWKCHHQIQYIFYYEEISPTLAGVTFLAFANGAPDVLTAVLAGSSSSPST